jgi:hypothetical protein
MRNRLEFKKDKKWRMTLKKLPPTYAKDFWMRFGDTSLVEKRDEGLVGGLDQHKLKWVPIESNALQRTNDCVENCSTGDYIRHI